MSARFGSAAAFRPTVWMLLRLALLWLVLAALAHIANEQLDLPARTARVLSAALSALGIRSGVTGTIVLCGASSLEIIEECTGLSFAAALAAFAVAFPARLRTRLHGAFLLSAFALAWNALRLIGLAVLMAHAPRIASFVHDVVWQVLTVGVGVLAAMAWTRRAART